MAHNQPQLQIQTHQATVPPSGTTTAQQVTPQNFKLKRGEVQPQPQTSNHVSKAQKERAEIAKNYIESKYNRRRAEETERKDAWEMLE
jgi:hypothetical protein